MDQAARDNLLPIVYGLVGAVAGLFIVVSIIHCTIKKKNENGKDPMVEMMLPGFKLRKDAHISRVRMAMFLMDVQTYTDSERRNVAIGYFKNNIQEPLVNLLIAIGFLSSSVFAYLEDNGVANTIALIFSFLSVLIVVPSMAHSIWMGPGGTTMPPDEEKSVVTKNANVGDV